MMPRMTGKISSGALHISEKGISARDASGNAARPGGLTRTAIVLHIHGASKGPVMSLLLESSYYAFAFYAALNALIMLILGMLVTPPAFAHRPTSATAANRKWRGPSARMPIIPEWTPMALLLMWVLTGMGFRTPASAHPSGRFMAWA